MCENIIYDIKLSKMGENSAFLMEDENNTLLYTYASPKVKIEEEYTLMGTTAIISAAGGSLGLFLGFSCYGAIWHILDMLERVYNSIFSSHKQKKAKARNGWRRRQ